MIDFNGLKAYTVAEAAPQLNLSIQTLRRYINTGKITGRKIGVTYYVTEDALKAFIEGKEVCG